MSHTHLTMMLLTTSLVLGCSGREDDPNQPNLSDNRPVVSDPETSESATNREDSAVSEALCEIVPVGDSGVSGTVRFTAVGDTVQVRGQIDGLTPGMHGFHVHEKGDLSDKETGKSTGGHFNPTNQPHGRPSHEKRHVGDLGNIEADEDGKAIIEIDDTVIRLDGPNSILGRGLVIHAEEDQFTQPSGDAGARVGFGVIEESR